MTDLTLTLYASALVAAMVASLALASVGFLRNRAPGAGPFMMGNLAAFLYSLGSLFEIQAATEAQLLTALTIEYIGIAPLGPLLFLTSMSATRGSHVVDWRNRVLLFLVPLVTVAMVATNSCHHLFYTSVQLTHRGPFTVPVLGRGPFYLLNLVYMNICLLFGSLIPLREASKVPRAHRMPRLLLFFGSLFPWSGMGLFLLGWSPWGLDVAPFGLTISAGVFAVALFRFRLFDLPPFIADQVFANMKEGVLVLDQRDRIIGINPALSRELRLINDNVVGQDLSVLGLPDLRGQLDVTITHGTVRRVFQLDRSPLLDRKKRFQGEIFMLTDITQREELAERLATMARIDELTGLVNRRGFLERLNAEADRFRRYGKTPSLAIADIDHFKRINDTWGHHAGDEALVHVAKIWSAGLRASDVLGRYGGEEFVFLMPETPIEEARNLLERLRGRLEDQPLVWSGHTIKMTASFGVASGKPTLAPGVVDELISTADRALYQAKRSGRNQVQG